MNDKLLTALLHSGIVLPDLSTCYHSNLNELTKDKIPLVGSKQVLSNKIKLSLDFSWLF